MSFGKIFSVAAPVVGGTAGFLMGGPTGAAIGAGFGTSAAGAFNQAEAQKEANKTNLEIANRQMEFQERLSNSAYQRQYSDMVKAGLNPILAANGGGASSPQGASTTVQAAAPDLSRIVSSGVELAQLSREFSLTDAQTTLMKQQVNESVSNQSVNDANAKQIAQNTIKAQAETSKALAETKKLGVDTKLVNKAIDKTQADMVKTIAETGRLNTEMPAIKAKADYEKTKNEIETKMAPYDAAGSRLKKIIDTGVNAAGAIRGRQTIINYPNQP